MRLIGNVEKDAQVRAVASGALPSGDAVIVNADGTVGVVEETSGTEAVGAAVQFESGNTVFGGSVFDSVNGKVVIVYRDAGNSNYGTAVIGTVSGSSIGFGTPVVFQSFVGLGHSACFDEANGKVVVAYSDNTNLEKDGMAVVGTVSGTSIAFGTPVQFESNRADTPFPIYDSTSGKIVIAYADVTANQGKAIVGTVSGTSISFGTSAVFNSAGTTVISGAHDTSSGKTVLTYSDSGNSNRGTCVVSTVAGTSISFGSEIVFETGGIARTTTGTVYDVANDKIVISFSDQGDTENAKAIVGAVSGTSISFGSAVTWQTGATQRNTAVYHAAAQKVIVLAEDESDSGKAKYAVGTVSGTAISLTTAADFTSVGHTGLAPAYDSSNSIAVVAYKKDSDSTGNAATLQIDYTSTNLTAENFLGFAAHTYADTQSALVNSTCTVDRNQTSLTAGQTYYVQTDGSLGTTAGDPSVVAGTAISSTEIIVKG